MALAAEATEFGDRFNVFALLVLPVAFFIGVGTYIRLADARIEDFWLLFGMNRLRHAYLEIAPGLGPYVVTGHHDDEQGLSETYGPGTENRAFRLIASTSTLVAVIDAVLAGAVVGLVANAAGTGSELSLFVGAVVTTVLVVSLVHHEPAPHRTWATVARAPLRATGRTAPATRVAGASSAPTTTSRAGASKLSMADSPANRSRTTVASTSSWPDGSHSGHAAVAT